MAPILAFVLGRTMSAVTRVALYVFAGFVALLGIMSMIPDEPRPTPTLVGDAPAWRPSPSNYAHLALLGLSTDQRTEVLRTEILVAGFTCDRVQRTFHQGPDNNSSSVVEFWSVACRDGHTYSIGVDPSGSTKVLSCGVLKAMAQVECFKKF